MRPVHRSATSKERGEEVKEVLGVGRAVKVEVSITAEKRGEEVEEVLRVEGAGVIPIGSAGRCAMFAISARSECPATIGFAPPERGKAPGHRSTQQWPSPASWR